MCSTFAHSIFKAALQKRGSMEPSGSVTAHANMPPFLEATLSKTCRGSRIFNHMAPCTKQYYTQGRQVQHIYDD